MFLKKSYIKNNYKKNIQERSTQMIETLISIPLIAFCFSMAITPGPNNIMLTASGANYGFKRTIPHILGIELGMIALFLVSASGLGMLFNIYPQTQIILKTASSAYLLYFAYKIAFKKKTDEATSNDKPLTLFQASLFQFINPKALIITTSTLASFTKESNYALSALQIVIVFGIVCIPSISVWAGFGTFISRFLNNHIAFRSFNITLGLLTALSVLMIIR